VSGMDSSLVVVDCPECRAKGTVVLGVRGVCFACFDEFNTDDEIISRGGTELTPPLSTID